MRSREAMQKIKADQIEEVSAHLIKGTKRPPERAAAVGDD
jgi:hypothetical protein